MTFEVRVKCLICRKLTSPVINWEDEIDAEACNLLHKKFCTAMKLEFSPEFRIWDFSEEPFPYCESCSQRLQRLGELIDQLRYIEEEINGSLATVSALVITSDKNDTDTIDPLITPRSVRAKEYFQSPRLQEKQKQFRSLIVRRFDPRVTVQRCDNCNYPDIVEEDYDYGELVPITTFPEIKQDIPGFLDDAADETILYETEYKVDTSAIVITGVEPDTSLGLITAGTSSCAGPPLTLVSKASDKGESPTTTALLTTVNKRNPKPCLECGEVFETKQNLYKHRVKAHVGPKFQCDQCEAKYHFNYDLRRHMLAHSGDKSYSCDQCVKSFARKHQLKQHSRVHFYKRLSCSLPTTESHPDATAEKIVSLGTEYKIDYASSNVPSNVESEIVIGLEDTRNSFSEVPTLTLVSNGSEDLANPTTTSVKTNDQDCGISQGSRVCQDCDKDFPTFQSLYLHRMQSHPAPGLNRGHSGSNVQMKSELKEPALLTKDTGHTEKSSAGSVSNALDKAANPNASGSSESDRGKKDSSWQCRASYDGATDTWQYNGYNFKTVENGYECCTCGHLFVASKSANHSKDTNVRRHIEHRHIGIPRNRAVDNSPKTCEECGKVCMSKHSLYKHRLKVHRSHKFQCGHCGLKFPTKGGMERHVVTHIPNRKRPYPCEQCGTSFVQRHHLTNHVSRVHTRK